MAYDIKLSDPSQSESTPSTELTITYNYAKYFYRAFGVKGIRAFYGMRGKESIPLLEKAINELDDDMSSNYYDAAEGNAKQALQEMMLLAQRFPEGVWEGD